MISKSHIFHSLFDPKIIFVELVIFSLISLPMISIASTTDGTIQDQYAWGENVGWVNFAATGSNVHVTDTGLSGNAWDANYGWIYLSPSNSGVKNDGQGNLSGSAWSSGGGYIEFTSVVIDSAGKFTGMASGTAYGMISFDCSKCSVTTDWRPVSSRPVYSSVTSGSSSGSYTSDSGGLISSISNYFFPTSDTAPASPGKQAITSISTSTISLGINSGGNVSSPRSTATAPIWNALVLKIAAAIASIILIVLLVLKF